MGRVSTAAGLVTLYSVTLFVSAILLFSIQPLFAKMVLPLLGGAPAVWNTCLVFFQTLLLGGYAYSHLISSRLPMPAQMLLHLMFILGGCLVLPLALRSAGTPPVNDNPIPWLFATLTLSLGLPFFVVSATAPLLQRWFSLTQHRLAHDPYFLYAASICRQQCGQSGRPGDLSSRDRAAASPFDAANAVDRRLCPVSPAQRCPRACRPPPPREGAL